MSYLTDREMKLWNYKLGDKVYVWDPESKEIAVYFSQEECANLVAVGEILEIHDNTVRIKSVSTGLGIPYYFHIDNVWKVGTGPLAEENPKTEADKVLDDLVSLGQEMGLYDMTDNPMIKKHTKKADIFELEQRLTSCWCVTDDINDLAAAILDSEEYEGIDPKFADKLSNILFGIKEVYEMRFNRCWEEFEAVAYEYHRRGK